MSSCDRPHPEVRPDGREPLPDKAGESTLPPRCRSLFCETNPIPIKAAMAAMGWCDNYLRLPLVPMEEAHAGVLYERMRGFGLIG